MRATSVISIVLVSGVLGACSVYTQTSSGQDWLASYSTPKAGSAAAGDIDAQVRKVAAVEPILRLPARIGIARLDRSGLSAIPAEEAEHWTEAASRLGPGFGEFVPVSPMIAAMVEQPIVEQVPTDKPWRAYNRESMARHTMDTIRLAAARQHLDAVLIYEVDGTADSKDNPLSLGEWTLIGAFVLPSQNVKAAGVAQAMLMDVRNGYPYGTIQSSADDKSLSTRVESRETGEKLREKVMADAVAKLTGETEEMMRKLKPELAALDVKVKPRR
jgi:predicted membrane-bound mannosyltransferase